MQMPTVSDTKPAEPSDLEYLEKKAAADACFEAADYAGAKQIYTELLYDPRYRNAVVYSSRSVVNLQLNLPFSALDDAICAYALTDKPGDSKATLSAAEAAMRLNLFKLAADCFATAGEHEKAEEALKAEQTRFENARRNLPDRKAVRALARESNGRVKVGSDETLLGFCPYSLRPQLPPVDPATTARMLDEINRNLRKIEVRDAPGMGRGIFATRTIKRGEVILIEEPFVAGFADGDRCQQCFRELAPSPKFPTPPEAVACPGCGIERYCGEECRSKAWQLYHLAQCEHAAGLKEIRRFCATGRSSSALSPVVIARLVGMTMCSDSWPCHTLSLPQMQLLSPPRDGLVMSSQQLLDIYQALRTCLDLRDDPRFNVEWFEAVYTVLMTNGFIISREGDDVPGVTNSKLGSGIYPIATFFNHSCEPNATWSAGQYDHSKHAFNSIVVHATKKIRAGEQIFITYTMTDMPYQHRQMSLTHYGFRCSCPKCEREKPRVRK